MKKSFIRFIFSAIIIFGIVVALSIAVAFSYFVEKYHLQGKLWGMFLLTLSSAIVGCLITFIFVIVDYCRNEIARRDYIQSETTNLTDKLHFPTNNLTLSAKKIVISYLETYKTNISSTYNNCFFKTGVKELKDYISELFEKFSQTNKNISSLNIYSDIKKIVELSNNVLT